MSSPISLQRKLPVRQTITREEQDAKVKNAAQLYEKQFLREMVKAMRSTVSEGGLMPSSQTEKIFREQLDDQYVDKWSERGGIGLADLIYDQIIQRHGSALGLAESIPRLKGPLAMTGRDRASENIAFKAQSLPENTTKLRFAALDGRSHTVTSPWSGVLSDVSENQGRVQIRLRHPFDLVTDLSFTGRNLPELQPGSSITAGAALGTWLASDSPDLVWTLSSQSQNR